MSAFHPDLKISQGCWDGPLLTGAADLRIGRIVPTGADPLQTIAPHVTLVFVEMVFTLLLSTAGAAQRAVFEPLEPPVVSLNIAVRQEANGQCAEVDAGIKGQPPLIRMGDICHGWSTQSCADAFLVKAQGVVEDAAQVLFLREHRAADLVPLIDRQIARIWPGNEHLHLAFTRVRCEGWMTVSFDGSRVPKAASASANGIKGTITLRSANRIRVTIQSTD